MMRNLKALKPGGKCVRVFGIDVPDTVPIDKDVWMARVISSVAGTNPMLVLVGNRHTFKKVEWESDDDKRTVLAENLNKKGLKVASVMQYWEKDKCISKIADFLDAENTYTGVYVDDIIKPLSIKTPSTISDITDGVIVWNCGTLSAEASKQAEVSKITEDIKTESDNSAPEIETDREKIEKRIKRGIPVTGMTKQDVIKTLGEPKERSGTDSSDYEKWSYECYDEAGYYYECYNLIFENNILTRISNWPV